MISLFPYRTMSIDPKFFFVFVFFLNTDFLYSARSQQKSFKFTFSAEQIYTLLLLNSLMLFICFHNGMSFLSLRGCAFIVLCSLYYARQSSTTTRVHSQVSAYSHQRTVCARQKISRVNKFKLSVATF